MSNNICAGKANLPRNAPFFFPNSSPTMLYVSSQVGRNIPTAPISLLEAILPSFWNQHIL